MDLLVDSSTPRVSLLYFILRKMKFSKWSDKLEIVQHAGNSSSVDSSSCKAQKNQSEELGFVRWDSKVNIWRFRSLRHFMTSG